MRKIVLTLRDIENLLESTLDIDDKDNANLLRKYQEDDDEHSIISYLLLTAEDHLIKKGYPRDVVVKKIFSLETEIWMSFFSCDGQFVNFLMRNTKSNTLDIIDELPQLVEKFHNHEYPQIRT